MQRKMNKSVKTCPTNNPLVLSFKEKIKPYSHYPSIRNIPAWNIIYDTVLYTFFDKVTDRK